MSTKTCRTCRTEKPATAEHFNFRNKAKGSLDHQCRPCHRVRMQTVNRNYYRSNRAEQMIREYSRLDRAAGRECDLNPEWFRENIEAKPCFYCGTEDEPRGSDRIDNSKGHTAANVVPCCKLCNKTRNNNFTVDEMKQIGAVIRTIRAARLR